LIFKLNINYAKYKAAEATKQVFFTQFTSKTFPRTAEAKGLDNLHNFFLFKPNLAELLSQLSLKLEIRKT